MHVRGGTWKLLEARSVGAITVTTMCNDGFLSCDTLMTAWFRLLYNYMLGIRVIR